MKKTALLCLLILLKLSSSSYGIDQITVSKTVDATQAIPISLNGYSGAVLEVLKTDLEVQGFSIVPEGQFSVTGSSAPVKGALTDKNKNYLFNRAYSGEGREAAHTLADDIVFAILKIKGIGHSKIAFKSQRGNASELYYADFDGSNATPITSDKVLVGSPSWIPGTRALLYTSWKSGFADILIHDLTSGERRNFAKYPGSNLSPSVSPDGKKVAMILSKGGSPDLYIADIDGKNVRQLTKGMDDESSPCWSPDSTKICYVSRYATRPSLFVLPVEGGTPRRLSVGGVSNITEPDWSPDGKTIVFTAQMGSFNICTVPAEGGTAVPIIEGEDPAWATNSRTVIFTRRESGIRVLSLLDVPTKHVKDIHRISGSCSQACWAR